MFNDYDFEAEYQCTPLTKSKHCSNLIYLILNLSKIEKQMSRPGIDIFREYVEQNPEEVLIKNEKGFTPLMIAARNSKRLNLFECIEILLESFKRFDTCSKKRLSHETNIDTTDNNGQTALIMAAYSSTNDSDLKTVDILLQRGATVNFADKNKYTALSMAARYSNTDSNFETVTMLVKHGANIDHTTKDGWTPLMLAARNSRTTSNLETVIFLLNSGASVNLRHNDGRTALAMAVRNSNTDSTLETVKLLLERGADPNTFDQKILKTFGSPHTKDPEFAYARYSCLTLACTHVKNGSSTDTVDLLLKFGAQINYGHIIQPDAIKLIVQYECIYKNKLPQILMMGSLTQEDFEICIKIVNTISHQKLCLKHMLREIRCTANEYMCKPDSVRHKLTALKWNLSKIEVESEIPEELKVYLGCSHLSQTSSLTHYAIDVLKASFASNSRFEV